MSRPDEVLCNYRSRFVNLRLNDMGEATAAVIPTGLQKPTPRKTQDELLMQTDTAIERHDGSFETQRVAVKEI